MYIVMEERAGMEFDMSSQYIVPVDWLLSPLSIQLGIALPVDGQNHSTFCRSPLSYEIYCKLSNDTSWLKGFGVAEPS